MDPSCSRSISISVKIIFHSCFREMVKCTYLFFRDTIQSPETANPSSGIVLIMYLVIYFIWMSISFYFEFHLIKISFKERFPRILFVFLFPSRHWNGAIRRWTLQYRTVCIPSIIRIHGRTVNTIVQVD